MKVLNDYVVIQELKENDNEGIITPATYKKTIAKGILVEGEVEGVDVGETVIFVKERTFPLEIEVLDKENILLVPVDKLKLKL